MDHTAGLLLPEGRWDLRKSRVTRDVSPLLPPAVSVRASLEQEHRADARFAIPPGPEGPGFSRRNGEGPAALKQILDVNAPRGEPAGWRRAAGQSDLPSAASLIDWWGSIADADILLVQHRIGGVVPRIGRRRRRDGHRRQSRGCEQQASHFSLAGYNCEIVALSKRLGKPTGTALHKKPWLCQPGFFVDAAMRVVFV